jgi:hypothetical protein
METLPYPELVVWDNSKRENAGLFGRYLGLLEVKTRYAYFQDDDCIVRNHDDLLAAHEPGIVVGNFKRDKARERFYEDTTLVGWGSIFDKDLPLRAWYRYAQHYALNAEFFNTLRHEFTWPVLTPNRKVLVDIKPGGDVEWLNEGGEVFARPNRMSQQDGFYDVIDDALARARMVRDAG